uniref:Myb/SANT-like domain-containing protein n=1 Tax=Setaria italica TaxID=4555 RepID=K4A0R5_SETIT
MHYSSLQHQLELGKVNLHLLGIRYRLHGWEGSATDSRALRSAMSKGFQELFNHHHTLLRNHVERTLGVLKKLFPILKVSTFHTLENQVKISEATTIFHNLIRLLHGDKEWLDHQPDNIDPTHFISLPNGDQINDLGTAQGNALRDTITQEIDGWKRLPKLNVMVRGSPKLLKQRADWNPTLEKSLVEILHEYKDSGHRSDNGWNFEGWNKMVKEFHLRNKFVSYIKAPIQDKEGQRKRDYKMLKVARMQSGSKWNKKRNIVEGSPAMWENLMVKFQNNKASFPLYDALGELYDGHLAKETYNFTSIESQHEEELLHQIDDVEDGAQADEEALQEIHEVHDEDDEKKEARDEEEETRKKDARDAEIVTKSKENRETFIYTSEEDQESALIWLRNEIA